MAFLSSILAAISRKLANLLRTILGWSVTALFGRLGKSRQTALIVTVVLAMLWPLLVAGIFVPRVAGWAVAFLPLHKWINEGPMRVLWFALAIAVPPLIGLLVSWIVPRKNRKGGVLNTILHGYPLTVGLVLSFLLTAIVVAIVKVKSLARRWIEEHVMVQPNEGQYRAVVEDLRLACEHAGLTATIEPVPVLMSLPTRLLKWMAKGAIDPIVPEEPRRLRAGEIELYLYPSDLLLRGTKHAVARVRAELTRTPLERHAFLVGDPEAKRIQEQLQRCEEMIARHASPKELRPTAELRLEDIRRELNRVQMPFEEWVILDRLRHRLHDIVRGASEWPPREFSPEEVEMLKSESSPSEVPLRALLSEALQDAKALLKVEVELAKDELRREIKGAKRAGGALTIALVFAAAGIAILLTAVVIALGTTVVAALSVGGASLAIAAIAAIVGYKSLPKRPLVETKARLEQDVQQFKERIA